MNVLVFDTETAPIVKTEGVQPELMRVYDLGWVVMDTKCGDIVSEGNVAIMDTFKRADVMGNAYYAAKLPQYYQRMTSGTLAQATLKDARAMIRNVCHEFKVRQAWAYNVRFDYVSLNATINDYSGGFVQTFMPFGVELCDIMSAATQGPLASKKYAAWCRANALLTKNGRPRATAEAAYRYLLDEPDFVESHTALDDSRIEARILWECIRRKDGYLKAGRKWGQHVKTKK